jgi:peptidoglycan-associated lipoprotein
MALVTRRANHVRVLLIKQGVDFNRIYTISNGKEKPLAQGHSPDAWKRNRRCEYKIYHKR